ncbi:MAG: RNA polymerase sigma-70 factor [Parafilimonas sp.]
MFTLKNSYSHLSDEKLFYCVKQKDEKAFDELYKRCSPLLIEAASKKLQCRESAKDIVQDLFLSFYLKSNTLEFTVSLRAYLHQALKYKVLNVIRSRVIRERYRKSLFFSEYCKNDFAQALEAKECRQKIQRTLRQLPDKCRKVFELSRNENLSYKDISDDLGIAVSTVEKHITKALKILRANVLREAC